MESFKNIESIEALDNPWYKRFSEIYFEDYVQLDGDGKQRELEKEAFLTGVSENPILDYPALANFDFTAKEQALLELKADILEQEPNEYVKKIYRTKINEIIATVRMLNATQSGNDKKFDRYSTFIFGKPTKENTDYIVQTIKKKLEGKKPENEIKKQAIYELLNLFNSVELNKVEDFAEGINFPTVNKVDGGEIVSDVEEIQTLFLESLKELGLDDWKIVVDTNNKLTGVRTDQASKVIEIPSDEKIKERAISKNKLHGLVEHEIKTHALRRHNGEHSKLKLLGLGLDRYIKGEEGVATYAEQQVTGAKEFAGIPKYFAITVAKGFDGKPRDFRETFKVMKNYYLVVFKDGEDLNKRAEISAWKDCVRIFRGTTGKTPGAVYTKDLAYFTGNKDIWHLVSKNSDVVNTFSIGKFDSTNKEHLYLLSKLGILDGDLIQIEYENETT